MLNRYITRLFWTNDKIEDRYWIESESFVLSSHSTKPDATSGIKGTAHPYVHAPHTQNPNNPSLSRFEDFQMLKLSVENLTLFILHNTLIFL